MISIRDLKNNLNDLRDVLGLKPINGNLSRAQLTAKIEEHNAQLKAAQPKTVAKAKPHPKGEKIPAAKKAIGITINDLCVKHGINPKVARAKLRKTRERINTLSDKGWVFNEADVPAILEIIKKK